MIVYFLEFVWIFVWILSLCILCNDMEIEYKIKDKGYYLLFIFIFSFKGYRFYKNVKEIK